MSAAPARAGIDARLLEWMSEPQWRRDDERFRRLALRDRQERLERLALSQTRFPHAWALLR